MTTEYTHPRHSSNPLYDTVSHVLQGVGRYKLLTLEEERELTRIVRDRVKSCPVQPGGVNSYEKMPEIMRYVKACPKAARAFDRLVEANQRLIFNRVKRDEDRGLPITDLFQEGAIGMMTAILRFDPDKGYKLSTYSCNWLDQSSDRALSGKARLIRIPVHVYEKVRKLKKTRIELTQELNRYPTVQEISERSQIPLEKIEFVRESTQSTSSLNRLVGKEQDTELGDMVAGIDYLGFDYNDELTVEDENNLVLEEARNRIERLIRMANLTDRELEIVCLRHGYGHDRAYNLSECGAMLDLSRERVRQIQARAERKLRQSRDKDLERIKQEAEMARERYQKTA